MSLSYNRDPNTDHDHEEHHVNPFRRFISTVVDTTASYDTTKVVRYHIWWAGILRLALMLTVLLYLIIKVIVLDKAYRESDTVVGAFQIRLTSSAAAVNISELPYCDQAQNHTGVPTNFTAPCELWDPTQALYFQGSTAIITTRAVRSVYNSNCTFNDPNHLYCDQAEVQIGNPQIIYPAGIENFSINILHSFVCPNFHNPDGDDQFIGSNADLTGTFDGLNRDFPPAGPDDPVFEDVLTVNELLGTLNLGFEQQTDAFGTGGVTPDETYRFAGLQLILRIAYDQSNMKEKPSYVIMPERVPRFVMFAYESVPMGANSRVEYIRHGIGVTIVQSGFCNRFNFQTLLVNIMASLGLMAAIPIIMEFILSATSRHFTDKRVEDAFDNKQEPRRRKFINRKRRQIGLPSWPTTNPLPNSDVDSDQDSPEHRKNEEIITRANSIIELSKPHAGGAGGGVEAQGVYGEKMMQQRQNTNYRSRSADDELRSWESTVVTGSGALTPHHYDNEDHGNNSNINISGSSTPVGTRRTSPGIYSAFGTATPNRTSIINSNNYNNDSSNNDKNSVADHLPNDAIIQVPPGQEFAITTAASSSRSGNNDSNEEDSARHRSDSSVVRIHDTSTDISDVNRPATLQSNASQSLLIHSDQLPDANI